MSDDAQAEEPPTEHPARFEHELQEAVKFVTESLGLGLTEAIYRNAVAIELRNRGYTTSCEVPVPITFCDEVIGMIRSDIVCLDDNAEGTPSRIVELKVAARITPSHSTQARAYLKRARAGSTAYVVNFGPDVVQLEFVHLRSREETEQARKRARGEYENVEPAV